MGLLIGRLISPFAEAAASAFARRGLRYPPDWSNCPENIARIDIFNLASVNAFLEHARKIASLSAGTKFKPTDGVGSDAAIVASGFRERP